MPTQGRQAGASRDTVRQNDPHRPTASRRQRAWPWLKRGAAVVFFVAIGALLVSQGRQIEWHKVVIALENYPAAVVWSAALLAAASFMLYSCFDLLGRSYTGHALSSGAVMATTFVSYAFNLNLGSLLGGIATRYRLYSRLGLELGVITRVLALSMLTNWSGYLLLAGLLFTFNPPLLPGNWQAGAGLVRVAGGLLLALAAAYLTACAFRRPRRLSLRGHALELPSGWLAVLQLAMGAANWLMMSGILYVLLQQRIDFSLVAGTLLLAAVAGIITHIPANLGVLEAVFVALLAPRMPQHDVLAAVLAYRVVYYLVPLGLAGTVYVLMEAQRKKPPPPDHRR